MTTGTTGFEIRSSRHWRGVQAALIIVATAAWLTWIATLAAQGDAAAPWWLLPVGLPIFAAARWHAEAAGRLRLDAGGWCFEDPDRRIDRETGELAVALDLGRWMLIRWGASASGGPRKCRWFALSHDDMPRHWQAFRRAVYSPRPSPAGPSAQAPADPPA